MPNDPIGTRSTGGHLENSRITNRRLAIAFIPLFSLFPRGEPLFHFSPINILETFKDFSPTTRKYSKTFHQHPKMYKDFFACKFVLAANHRLYSGNIQTLFGQQSTAATISRNRQQQSRAAINSSNHQQQSTAAINSSNQQQQPAAAINSSNQQQKSTAATSSSNQQQQSAAAISSSNQQQQSAAAISSSNQQQQSTGTINISNNQLSSYQQYLHNPRRLPLVTNTVPSRGYALLEVDLGLAARLRVQPPLPRLIFVIFHFTKIPFLRFFPFC